MSAEEELTVVPTSIDLEGWLQRLEESLLQKALDLDEGWALQSKPCGRATGAIAFVDMRGFTVRCRDEDARIVANIAVPFIQAVIQAARDTRGLVDKTIGDEVMVFFPDGGEFRNEQAPTREHGWARAVDFIRQVRAQMPRLELKPAFSAGISVGEVWIERVGLLGKYQEWSCYGQPVNIASRIRGHYKPEVNDGDSFVGVAISAAGEGSDELAESIHTAFSNPRPPILTDVRRIEDLGGTGPVWGCCGCL